MPKIAYELWHIESCNLMASFDTLAEARAERWVYRNASEIAVVRVDDSDTEGDFVVLDDGDA